MSVRMSKRHPFTFRDFSRITWRDMFISIMFYSRFNERKGDWLTSASYCNHLFNWYLARYREAHCIRFGGVGCWLCFVSITMLVLRVLRKFPWHSHFRLQLHFGGCIRCGAHILFDFGLLPFLIQLLEELKLSDLALATLCVCRRNLHVCHCASFVCIYVFLHELKRRWMGMHHHNVKAKQNRVRTIFLPSAAIAETK